MSYLTAIKTAIFIFPFIALLFNIPFVLYQYHKYGSINKFRVFIVYSFILYMITIYFLVILPLPNKEDVINNSNMIRLQPFAFISNFMRETSLVISDPSTYLKALCEPCVYIVIFNIFMTIPFGMYLRYYFKCNLKKVFILGFLLSLFFELTQLTGLYFIYPKPYRLFDLDDLFLNTIGAGVGYFIMGIIDNYLPTRDEIDKESYDDGKVVSGFRRITIFLLDLFLYIVLSFVFRHYFITFICYYWIIPIITKGKTLGSKFLNVKVTFDNHFIIKTIIRNVYIFGIYILFPTSIIILLVFIVYNCFNMIIYILIIVLSIVIYLFHIIVLVRNKKLYYDKILKTSHLNTLKEGDD